MEDQAPALKVRKVTGDVVLSLTRDEAKGLSTVRALRAEAGSAVSRRVEQVSLVAGARQLQDEEALEALLPEDAAQEVVMAIQPLPPFDPSAGATPALKEMLLSPQRDQQLHAAEGYRRLLGFGSALPIRLIIEQGVVPRLLELCQVEDHKLQLESAGALALVTSGTGAQTRVVVDAGAVPVMVRLLQSPNAEVCEQAVSVLGNIAGVSWQFQDLVLQSGAMLPLLRLLRRASAAPFTENAVLALSGLCRGEPQPDLAQAAPALEMFAQTLRSADSTVITESAWALTSFAGGSEESVTAILDAGVLPRLVELLAHPPSERVLLPVLRTLGGIVSGGNDHQRQRVLSAGVLPQLRALVGHPRRLFQVESCLAVSGILAGNQAQIQDVIDAGLVPPLLEFLRRGQSDLKLAAARALAHATSGGSAEQVRRLVEDCCVPAMVGALSAPVDNALGDALTDGLQNILRAGERLKRDAGLDANPWAALVTGANRAAGTVAKVLAGMVEEARQEASELADAVPGAGSGG